MQCRKKVRGNKPAGGSVSGARVERLEERRLLSTAYHLTFDDEFNSLTLANGADHPGWIPRDSGDNDYYSANSDAEYFSDPIAGQYNPYSVNSGVLSITAEQTPTGTSYTSQPYLSGMLSTAVGWSGYEDNGIADNYGQGFSQEYGYFEERAELPASKGAWPAFWLMPTNGNVKDELDIYEFLGINPNGVYQTQHYNDYQNENQVNPSVAATTGFHTYGLAWTPTTVTFYIDGVQTMSVANQVNTPMYLLTGMEIEGAGSWRGYGGPANPAQFPAAMKVDYIHVYSSDSAVPAAVPQPGYSASIPSAVGTVVSPDTDWTHSDVGSPMQAGFTSLDASNNLWTVSGAGTGIGGTSDQFTYLSKTLNGDASIVANLPSVTDISSTSQAGLMIRSDTTASSAFASISVTAGNQLTFQWRSSSGATAQSASVAVPSAGALYVKLNRSGNTFSAYYSDDQTTWTQVGGYESASVNSSALFGMAVTSTVAATPAVGFFGGVTLFGQFASSTAIGTTPQAGATQFDGTTYTVGSYGTGVGGTADQMQLTSSRFSGDQTLIAEITAISGTNAAAQAGVIFRSDNTPGSIEAGVFATEGDGVEFVDRTTSGATAAAASVPAAPPTPSNPIWVKLVKSNGNISAFYGTGTTLPTTWTAVGSAVAVAFSGKFSAGLESASGVNTASSGASFSNVTITSTTAPIGWTDVDLGTPAPAGNAAFDGTTWTVNGGGGGVGGVSDQANTVYQQYTGSGTIVARVVSQTETYAYAGAGVMLRNSLAPTAAYGCISITPSGRTYFSYRTSDGGTATYSAVTLNGATWVKLTRSGNNFYAYCSVDGVSWTAVNTSAIVINADPTMYGGLYASSHQPGTLNTVKFTDVNTSGFAVNWLDQDIGTTSPPGTAAYDGANWTINSQGAGSGGNDQLNLLSQTLDGDGSVVSDVTSFNDPNAYGTAGVMIRSSNAANAAYASIGTESNGRVFWNYRTTDGGAVTSKAVVVSVPVWLKVTRSGSNFSGWYSTDGLNWTQLGSTATVTSGYACLAGAYVVSDSSSAPATATFSWLGIDY